MNTQDVIETISRATNDLFATLRNNDETIRGFEATVERLERRITDLEELIAHERTSNNEFSTRMHSMVADLRISLGDMTKQRDEAIKEQVRLKDVILNVAAAVDSVVNPPTALVQGVNPTATEIAERMGEAPRPHIVDDKGLPHHPETGRFVEVPKAEEERPLQTGTDWWKH